MRLRVAAKRKVTHKSTFTANTRVCVSQLYATLRRPLAAPRRFVFLCFRDSL